MWLFANQGFMSIVAMRNRPDFLLVRSRMPGHIQQYFPKARVRETLQADYRFRAVIPRRVVGKVLLDLAMDIGYHNFKDSIPPAARRYHDACFGVWRAALGMQDGGLYSPRPVGSPKAGRRRGKNGRQTAPLFDDVDAVEDFRVDIACDCQYFNGARCALMEQQVVAVGRRGRRCIYFNDRGRCDYFPDTPREEFIPERW